MSRAVRFLSRGVDPVYADVEGGFREARDSIGGAILRYVVSAAGTLRV